MEIEDPVNVHLFVISWGSIPKVLLYIYEICLCS